jgi:hypothetical protein
MNDLLNWQAESQEDVALVTFNYDTLLDRAFASALGFNPARFPSPNLESYIERGPFSLFKPHGSVDWARLLENSDDTLTPEGIRGQHDLIAVADRLVSTDRFEINSYGNAWHSLQHESHQLAMPALAIPVNTKTQFECPPGHIQRLREIIPTVTRLLTIGWRGSEESFLDLWRTTTPKPGVQVVSPGGPDETVANLERVGLTVHIVEKLGFTDYMRERALTKLLP